MPLLGFLDHAEGVRLVVDREAAREAEVADLAAQDPHAHRVEGREPDRGGLASHQLLDPLAHLGGGLVGEGHRQDPLRRDAAGGDQPGDAVGEDAGLAAARAGEHEERPLGRLDRAALLGVEPDEQRSSLLGDAQTCLALSARGTTAGEPAG